MKKDLMKKFMNTYVGNNVHLTIKDGKNHLSVHTIQIIEKTDESCPITQIPVGDYFLRLIARNENDDEAAILCNWSEQLLQSLLENYTHAKEAGSKNVTMVKSGPNADNWNILWRPKVKEKATPYIS